jgi:hypothetical protein
MDKEKNVKNFLRYEEIRDQCWPIDIELKELGLISYILVHAALFLKKYHPAFFAYIHKKQYQVFYRRLKSSGLYDEYVSLNDALNELPNSEVYEIVRENI